MTTLDVIEALAKDVKSEIVAFAGNDGVALADAFEKLLRALNHRRPFRSFTHVPPRQLSMR